MEPKAYLSGLGAALPDGKINYHRLGDGSAVRGEAK